MPFHPRARLEEGNFHKVPVLLSLTKDEVNIWFRNRNFQLKEFSLFFFLRSNILESEMTKKKMLEENINHIVRQMHRNMTGRNFDALSHTIRAEYIYKRGYDPSYIDTAKESEEVPIQLFANVYI